MITGSSLTYFTTTYVPGVQASLKYACKTMISNRPPNFEADAGGQHGLERSPEQTHHQDKEILETEGTFIIAHELTPIRHARVS